MCMETAHSRGVCCPLELSFRLDKYSSKAHAITTWSPTWGSVGGGGRSFRRQGVVGKVWLTVACSWRAHWDLVHSHPFWHCDYQRWTAHLLTLLWCTGLKQNPKSQKLRSNKVFLPISLLFQIFCHSDRTDPALLSQGLGFIPTRRHFQFLPTLPQCLNTINAQRHLQVIISEKQIIVSKRMQHKPLKWNWEKQLQAGSAVVCSRGNRRHTNKKFLTVLCWAYQNYFFQNSCLKNLQNIQICFK